MKEFEITIANPCSQKWEDMQEVNKGRFCDNCQKTIVDLSAKTDAELIQFFKKKNDRVCGRFLPSQLNRSLVQPAPKLNWPWLVPMAMGATIVIPVHAQNLNINTAQIAALSPSGTVPSLTDSTKSLSDSTFTGKVVDSFTGKALVGVKIRQQGYQNVIAFTDTAGRFEVRKEQIAINHPYTYELAGFTTAQVALSENMIVKLTSTRIVVGRATISEKISDPLYIIKAGSNSCTLKGNLANTIQPEWIEALEVLRDANATAIYGAKAANGVVMITIKKVYEHKIDFSKKK